MATIAPAVKEPPVPAGEVFDEKNKLIGRYVYLQDGDQELLDSFFKSWLETYEHDSRFFITLDLETTGLKPHEGQILLVSISWDGKQSIIFCPEYFNLDLFKEVLNTVPINNQNIKFDFKWLMYHYKVECKVYLDTMIASQLGWAGAFPKATARGANGNYYETELGMFGLGNIAKQLLNGYELEKETRNEFIGMKLSDGFSKKQIEYAVKDSLITHKLVWPLIKRLQNQDLWDMWESIERPLIEVLVRSEIKGVKVNVKEVERLLDKKEKELADIYTLIHLEVQKIPENLLPKFPKGMFNPGSAQQIVAVLNAVGIKVINTEKSTLQAAQAVHQHPLLEHIIEWKKIKGIISKFLTKWLEEHIDPATSCIYTNFNSYGAETGRLSARDPNMQQIPGDLRSMIIARDGWKILSLDYSQFEFRGAAAITEEEYLMDAFIDRARLLPDLKQIASEYSYADVDSFVKAVTEGVKQKDGSKIPLIVKPNYLNIIHEFSLTDIHKRNAAIILGKDVDQVTAKERSVGKCVSLDTLIYTDKGIKRVGSLLPNRKKADTFYDLKGVKVLTDEGYKDAPTIYYNGKSKAVKVTTRTGRTLTCSPTHRFRSIDKAGKYVWVQAGKLKPDQEVFIKMGQAPNGKTNVKLDPTMYELAALSRLGIIEEEIVSYPAEFEDLILSYQSKNWITCTKILKSTKKEGVRIFSKELADLSRQFQEEIPAEVLSGIDPLVYATLRGLASKGNIGWEFVNSNTKILKQVQNLLTLMGIQSWLYSTGMSGKPTLHVHNKQSVLNFHLTPIEDTRSQCTIPALGTQFDDWKVYASKEVHEKLYDAQLFGKIRKNTFTEEQIKEVLSKEEFETTKFLLSNNLLRDEVVSVSNVADCEMCDVTVPENHTVVYEGFVTHNTLGYAVLYGAGPPRVQESLAKEGFYHSLTDCSIFLEEFFKKLPKVKRFIDETHGKVTNPGYISTIMGRKRYFELPPRYMTRKYEQEKQAAYREATNFCFQGANADATKKAMVDIDNVFQKYPEPTRPIILLTVHDEIVIEVKEEYAQKCAEVAERIMIETGGQSLNFKCPVEVSQSCGDTWQK